MLVILKARFYASDRELNALDVTITHGFHLVFLKAKSSIFGLFEMACQKSNDFAILKF